MTMEGPGRVGGGYPHDASMGRLKVYLRIHEFRLFFYGKLEGREIYQGMDAMG